MQEIGFIFDMDGVIIDNHEYHYHAWQKTSEKHGGVAFGEQFYREKMNGKTLSKLIEVVFPNNHFSQEKAYAIGMEKEMIYREIYQNDLKPTSGLIPFLEMARDKSIPMVVGTSAPVENVEFTLDGLDLRKYFVGVVDASMVSHGKPDPEVYLKCAKLVDRKPENCIVFEDAPLGMQAGHSAGSKVVALSTSHTRDEIDETYIFDDFTQITWESIKEVFNQ